VNGHVTAWLSAYYDGELPASRREQVAAHLRSCPGCQAELDALRLLSALLQEAPSPAGQLSAQRFSAQVLLRLPPAIRRPAWQRTLKVGWQLAPLGAVLVWVFGQAAWLVSGLVTVLNLPAGLGRAALLSGWSILPIAGPTWRSAETVVELGLLNLAFSALVALFLFGWLASWWVAGRRPAQGDIDARISQARLPG
jgi:predicted anti-sigma-YlaC factor YlaD